MMKIVLAHEDAIQILGGPNGSREFSVRLRRELIQTACEIYQQRDLPISEEKIQLENFLEKPSLP